MKITRIIPAAALLIAGSLSMSASCSHSRNSSDDQTGVTVSDDDSVHDTLNDQITTFKEEWNKKLDKLNSKISKEEKKVKKATGENKAKLEDKLDDLKTKQKELQQEVSGAGNKTADQWNDFKDDVSKKYQSLSENVKDLFKND
jgi:septal ring factor EnvC (AmiA/AmiB activator)